MDESFFYQHCHVVVTLAEVTFGKWEWSYALDAHARFHRPNAGFPTRELALADATRAARTRIARTSRLRTPAAAADWTPLAEAA
ncbi:MULTISPECIES: hypothetical protein [Cupriavidus]|uniref:Uncharacterized protein n=1 Tax=Cupriavidus taiwanensis TaxID=164546 RepID=A0A375F6T5_9BURK|nr:MULTISPECIES: hypothetical protein [Cupriavidus]MEC3764815.1 hypothetical protein [Cupriavidus sp. SS-3]ULX54799.1 hypothetical protein A9P79_23350 [Cupriavidus taiwanensis]SOY82277.1 conserved hypothetical protein [Cupriavidus taiwanensis]SOY82638.1 conserved hypothetical protein [Cupriavidus taiwanensis]SPA26340.1 conserved hypothetical protein [Cupriavidus taiwanensis]